MKIQEFIDFTKDHNYTWYDNAHIILYQPIYIHITTDKIRMNNVKNVELPETETSTDRGRFTFGSYVIFYTNVAWGHYYDIVIRSKNFDPSVDNFYKKSSDALSFYAETIENLPKLLDWFFENIKQKRLNKNTSSINSKSSIEEIYSYICNKYPHGIIIDTDELKMELTSCFYLILHIPKDLETLDKLAEIIEDLFSWHFHYVGTEKSIVFSIKNRKQLLKFAKTFINEEKIKEFIKIISELIEEIESGEL